MTTKKIRLWDSRFPPDQQPRPIEIEVDEALASAAVRAGVAAAANPQDAGALSSGSALSSSDPVETVIWSGPRRQLVRVWLPAAVSAIAIAAGEGAGIGTGSGGGGGTPPPATPVDGMLMWADLTDAATLFTDTVGGTSASNGQIVMAVEDKSGNDNHLTGTATVKSAIGLTFDGSTSMLTCDAIASALRGDYTAIFVLKPGSEALGTARTYFSLGTSTSSNPYHDIGTTATSTLVSARRGLSGGAPISLNIAAVASNGATEIVMIKRQGTTTTLWRDGQCEQWEQAQNPSGTFLVDQFTLGMLRRNANSAAFLGEYIEAVVYGSALAEADTNALDAYARNKHWGESVRRRVLPFLAAGQSLMSGRANPYTSPSAGPRTAYEIDHATGTSRGALVNPAGKDARTTFTGGYLPALGKALWDANSIVTVIYNGSEGATGLQPRTNTTVGNWSTLYPQVYVDSPGTEKLADRLKARALKLHTSMLHSPRYIYDGWVRILWDQWNSDGSATLSRIANSYSVDGIYSEGGYIAELVGLKDYVASAGVPVVMYAVGPGSHYNYDYPDNDEDTAVLVRRAQDKAMSIIDGGFVPSRIARTFGTLNYYQGDGTHYNDAGNLALGADLGANIAARIGTESAPSSSVYITLVDDSIPVEAGATASFKVLRHNNLTGSVSVEYSGAASGTLTFADGEQIKKIDVAVPGGTANGTTYTVTLSNPVGATLKPINGGPNSGTATVGGAVTVTLQTISLDDSTSAVGEDWSSVVVGKTEGSTWANLATSAGTLVVSGDDDETWSIANVPSLPITITGEEVYAGATNTPNAFELTITDASATLPATDMRVHFDFSDVATLFQDTGSTTPVDTSGQTIALATDQAATGDDDATGTATYLTNQINGLSAAQFNGTSDRLLLNTGTGGAASMFSGSDTPFTLHWVEKVGSLPASSVCVWGAGNSSGGSARLRWIMSSTGAISIDKRHDAGGGGVLVSVGTVTAGQVNIWSVRCNGATVDVLRNGTLVVDDGALDQNTATINRLALAAFYSSGSSLFAPITFGEFVGYAAAQSDTAFNDAHAYLVGKWS